MEWRPILSWRQDVDFYQLVGELDDLAWLVRLRGSEDICR